MSTGTGLAIGRIAQDWYDSVVRHFTAAGVALPDRRGIIPGEPRAVAWDCEQFVVTLGGVGFGPALDASGPSPMAGPHVAVAGIRHAVLDMTLVRCTPQGDRSGQPPSMAVLSAAGAAFMRDAGLLSQASVEFCARLRPGLPPEGRVQPGVIEPIGPSGGYHGMATVLTITAMRLE